MGRLFLALAAVVLIAVAWLTHDPAPVLLPPTPAALCRAEDRETATVIRVDDEGRTEVTPCSD
ncbi:hypothetical protein [Pseudonocardia sp. WMMC193]|uniref:hypothetical protein n=1 Tax=Pseudonocardia sp. WMMC193 TaxID=2911965 RepID=UPI001F325B10|nr:hypothetical protein [Pseudonocardia sp. WMMC193]MCF7548924.1 hypothetical protein [Pseudonocardia sp. WMMC193]